MRTINKRNEERKTDKIERWRMMKEWKQTKERRKMKRNGRKMKRNDRKRKTERNMTEERMKEGRKWTDKENKRLG